MIEPTVTHTIVKTVVQTHTVVENDLRTVLGQLIVLLPTGAGLALAHTVLKYFFKSDRLGDTANRVIAWAYSIVAAVVFVTLNHQVNWSNLFTATSLTGISVAFLAVRGSAQSMFEGLKLFSAAHENSVSATTSGAVNPEQV